jgi:hypothetical protein
MGNKAVFLGMEKQNVSLGVNFTLPRELYYETKRVHLIRESITLKIESFTNI